MYIRRKIRKRLIIVLVLIFGFVYWRGVTTYIRSNHMDCHWHLAYAVCTGKPVPPSILDVLKAGVKF